MTFRIHLYLFLSFFYQYCTERRIVYYAPREEKTWTVYSSCKLTPESKARVANTSCGLANFTPVERILFFVIPGPKIPHSRFWAGSESGAFGQGMAKNLYIKGTSLTINERTFGYGQTNIRLHLNHFLIVKKPYLWNRRRFEFLNC